MYFQAVATSVRRQTGLHCGGWKEEIGVRMVEELFLLEKARKLKG